MPVSFFPSKYACGLSGGRAGQPAETGMQNVPVKGTDVIDWLPDPPLIPTLPSGGLMPSAWANAAQNINTLAARIHLADRMIRLPMLQSRECTTLQVRTH